MGLRKAPASLDVLINGPPIADVVELPPCLPEQIPTAASSFSLAAYSDNDPEA